MAVLGLSPLDAVVVCGYQHLLHIRDQVEAMPVIKMRISLTLAN